jgi:hypothetical protein
VAYYVVGTVGTILLYKYYNRLGLILDRTHGQVSSVALELSVHVKTIRTYGSIGVQNA